MGKVKFFIISLTVLLMVLSMQSIAYGRNHKRFQDGGRFDKDVFFAKRNTFITEKVALTAEEAAVFIPLENELLNKKFDIGRECRKIERELHNKKNKTDDECNKLLKCREEEKEKRDKLDKDYLEKFKKILTAEQILNYQRADRDFFENYFRGNNR